MYLGCFFSETRHEGDKNERTAKCRLTKHFESRHPLRFGDLILRLDGVNAGDERSSSDREISNECE